MRQHAALHAVHAAGAGAGQRGGQGLGRHLAMVAVDQHQLGPAGEELGRAAFVLGDMGVAVAEHGAPGRAGDGHGQGIGGGAGGDEVDGGLGGLEDLAHAVA